MNSALSDANYIQIDHAIKSTYGWFQIFTTLVLSVGFWMGGFITFALPLIELYPQFEWSNTSTQIFEKCTQAEAWANPKWRVDWDSDKSLNNWISQLDLYWIDKWQIGLFGSLYYFGYLLGSIWFLHLSDTIGRK